ncbi:MAG: class I SAM-dependent methyltransferase [Actinobacteria bacterium]|nr:class I SAM-dependent methyltransferase [Actinomycetota bacterium]
MPVHASAEQGYAAVGADYEKGRPEYAPDAVAYLLQRLGVARAGDTKRVVDLAAGTGKFTRALRNAGINPVAVEPVAHMRDTLAATTPGVEIVDGTAEAMPFGDGSTDAVIVAQAFHWFDGAKALAEIHRVLKPLGSLGLVWNGVDRSVDWLDAIWTEVDALRDDTPHAWTYAWSEAFSATTDFSPLISATFRHDQPTDRDGLVARVASISFIARGSQESRDALIAHVRNVVNDAQLPEHFVLPYNCYLHWCRAV